MAEYKAQYVQFPAQGNVAVREETVTDEALAPGEILVRTEASIVSSGTELANLHNVTKTSTYPSRTGYGCIGRIVAAGSAVAHQPGDRIFYAGKHASLQRFNQGQAHQWGAAWPAPADIDAVDAAVACMAQIAMIGPFVTELQIGDSVAVFGLGLVGNLAAQLYQIHGARVIALDPVAARCAIAKSVGLDAIDVQPADQVMAVMEATSKKGARVTVDAVGHSAVVLQCVRCAGRFGQVILLGSPRASHTAEMTEAFSRIHELGLVVRGAHMWRLPPRHANETSRSVEDLLTACFELIRNGRLRVRELISHMVKPADVPAAYAGLRESPDKYMGVVIDWR